MNHKVKEIIGYTTFLVLAFAKKHGLSELEAFRYIRNFKGLGYIYDCYDAIHTFDFNESVESVRLICKQNGGNI